MLVGLKKVRKVNKLDKLDFWIGIGFTLSTFVWFILCLKLRSELGELKAELLAEIVALKIALNVHIAEAKTKHDQIDRHLEWVDERLERHLNSKTN